MYENGTQCKDIGNNVKNGKKRKEILSNMDQF